MSFCMKIHHVLEEIAGLALDGSGTAHSQFTSQPHMHELMYVNQLG